METTAPGTSSVPWGAPAWTDLATSDVEASREFYGRLFGWTYEVGGPETGGYTHAFLDGGRVAGILPLQPGSAWPDGWTTYLATADAAATAERAVAAGGSLITAAVQIAELGTSAAVADPSGGVIGLWQPAEHRGFDVTREAGAPVWHELHARDYEAAQDFYRRVFDWQLRVEGDSDEFRFVTAEFEGEPLAGIYDAGAAAPTGAAAWQLYFEVDDVDSSVTLAVELGGVVTEQASDTPYGRIAQLVDRTGASFYLMTPSCVPRREEHQTRPCERLEVAASGARSQPRAA